jgi:DMSO reductase anchor subunit
MLITLPLVLFIVMTEVSIGSVTVLVLLDWRNEVKRGFLVSYALIYLGLTYLTYLFQQNFSTPQLLSLYPQLDQHWVGYQSLPLLLFFLLMIPYNLLLWFDKRAGVDGGMKEMPKDSSLNSAEIQDVPRPARPAPRISVIRVLRLLSGVLTVLAGLTTLFVMAMIYRPLGGMGIGGILTVASFFAASLALGGVLTAMWLGHWYLVTPALSEKPLQFATTLVLLGVLAQVVFALSAVAMPAHSSTTAQQPSATPIVSTPTSTPAPNKNGTSQVKPPSSVPTVTPLSTDAITWVRVLVSFVIPLVLGGLAWKLIRDRSFQSATGMLYLVVVCTLAGEAMARGLFLVGL